MDVEIKYKEYKAMMVEMSIMRDALKRDETVFEAIAFESPDTIAAELAAERLEELQNL